MAIARAYPGRASQASRDRRARGWAQMQLVGASVTELDELRIEQLRIRERVWALENRSDVAETSAFFFLAKRRPKWWQDRWRILVVVKNDKRVYVPQVRHWWWPQWFSAPVWFDTLYGAEWFVLDAIK